MSSTNCNGKNNIYMYTNENESNIPYIAMIYMKIYITYIYIYQVVARFDYSSFSSSEENHCLKLRQPCQ